MPNDKNIYLAFIEIENILDNSNIEYQSFSNRIEFFTNNGNQVIINSTDKKILLFIVENCHTFSLESNNTWLSQPDNVNLFQFIEQVIEL